MDNSSDTVLTTKSGSLSRIHLLFPSAIFINHALKTTPSDADSCEEQDGNKQKFVGRMTAKLWPNLRQGVMKNMEEK